MNCDWWFTVEFWLTANVMKMYCSAWFSCYCLDANVMELFFMALSQLAQRLLQVVEDI